MTYVLSFPQIVVLEMYNHIVMHMISIIDFFLVKVEGYILLRYGGNDFDAWWIHDIDLKIKNLNLAYTIV